MLYFLGGGNMASAIVAGLRRVDEDFPIAVVEKNADKRADWVKLWGAVAWAQLPVLGADDVLLLAIKPQDVPQACESIQLNGALVLSIVAGLPVAKLSVHLGGTRRMIRIMPNTPAQVGLGVSGIFCADGASPADYAIAEKIFAPSGTIINLAHEDELHAITGISGSGSAYVFYLMNALQQTALDLGFDPQQARELSLQTFKGAVALAEQSGESFAHLQDKVTSRGGTTFSALTFFQNHQLAEILQNGALQAVRRSQELAQQD